MRFTGPVAVKSGAFVMHTSGMDRRILVIEDDPDIAKLVKLHLEDLGCAVDLEHDGRAGLRLADSGRYDLVVLDLVLPGLDGLEICKTIRSRKDYLPVLMLTARSSEIDRVLGLEIGADDYLTKPFSIMELVARVKAIFRRETAMRQKAADAPQPSIHLRNLDIDHRTRMVSVQGRTVDLTAMEFDLLSYFARHPGRVFSRAQLLKQVWGYEHEGHQHTVNTHINRLRGKIEPDPAEPTYIHTVWGVGYKMTDETED
jgi:DNA-binding response OmpR family regulator